MLEMVDKPAAEVVSIGWRVRSPTLARAYGGVPQNWWMVDDPDLSWMPSGSKRPAWSVFHEAATADKIVDLPVGKVDPDSEGRTSDFAEFFGKVVGAVRFELTIQIPSQNPSLF